MVVVNLVMVPKSGNRNSDDDLDNVLTHRFVG